MRPVSPYGIAKLFAFLTVRSVRAATRFHASNGILFNHSSARRGRNFVEAKIVDALLKRKFLGGPPLVLGNLEAKRDVGHSRDYVRAMWLMLQREYPDDYVVGTGMTASVRAICEVVLAAMAMPWKGNVETSDMYERPVELHHLRADSSKARRVLDWKPEYSLASVLKEMLTVRAEELRIGREARQVIEANWPAAAPKEK